MMVACSSLSTRQGYDGTSNVPERVPTRQNGGVRLADSPRKLKTRGSTGKILLFFAFTPTVPRVGRDVDGPPPDGGPEQQGDNNQSVASRSRLRIVAKLLGYGEIGFRIGQFALFLIRHSSVEMGLSVYRVDPNRFGEVDNGAIELAAPAEDAGPVEVGGGKLWVGSYGLTVVGHGPIMLDGLELGATPRPVSV